MPQPAIPGEGLFSRTEILVFSGKIANLKRFLWP